MRETFPIRRAAADDMRTVIRLIDEAAAWLETKGTDQWAQPWPNRAMRDARVLRGIRDGNTWIAEDRGEPIATITYRQNGNQRLWAAQEQYDLAIYVSRLIVSRDHAGNEIGAALIDWAGSLALQGWRAQWIRIDVWTTNLALHNYYEKRNFRPVRICQFDDPASYPSAALFQKPTAQIDTEAVVRFAVVKGTSLEPDKGFLLACP